MPFLTSQHEAAQLHHNYITITSFRLTSALALALERNSTLSTDPGSKEAGVKKKDKKDACVDGQPSGLVWSFAACCCTVGWWNLFGRCVPTSKCE